MYRVGTSIHSNINETTFDSIAKSGLSTVEINGTGYDFKAMKLSADRCGIELNSRHLPYMPLEERDLSIADNDLRQRIVTDFSELIKEAADVGIAKFIIHPSTPVTESLPREERKKYAMDTLYKLAEIAYKEGAVIAVEDMILSCLGNSADELAELISVNDKLCICFDVNHLFNDSHIDFIQKLGSKIVQTHISDYDFIQERHWLPGEGSIDWQALYLALQAVDYKGVWNYEVSMRGGIKMTDRGRELIWSDLYENAQEIFSGKQPHVIKA